MGAASSSHKESVIAGLEERIGRIPLAARYHKHPQRLEDDYDVLSKVLGTGYNGAVRLASRRAQSQSSQRKFAVKAFKTRGVNPKIRAQLESEVTVYLCMDHPHITRLFDVYDSEDHLDLVMECMEGGELFDRISELKTYSENDAADAVWQILLALNYLHSQGIVHRDVKLENFLYESRTSNHLKLIDFGFSKIWDPNIKMHLSCGTLGYVAPEVLQRSYTNQCDLWSLGVIAFILLLGYMPFSGTEEHQVRDISAGKFKIKESRWEKISAQAKDFVTALLRVDPESRLTAHSAMQHEWLVKRHRQSGVKVDGSILAALRSFGSASKFRRLCMEMMAWSLSNAERAEVREYFTSMDKDGNGTITLNELKAALEEKFHVPDEEARKIFNALDSNQDEEIMYSEFLAAMVSTRIKLHDSLLETTFKKFDSDSSGYITKDNLQHILGESGDDIDTLLAEAGMLEDGRISYDSFTAYLLGNPVLKHVDSTVQMIDSHLEIAQTIPKKTLLLSRSSLMDGNPDVRTHHEDPPPLEEDKPFCTIV